MILFGELIIMIVYLPILTLEGVEGKLFRPMALTVIMALAGSMVLSLTLMPVLASLFMKTHGGRSFLHGHLLGDNVHEYLAPCIYEGEGEMLGMAVQMEVPSVDQIQIVDREKGIGYLRLTCFQKTTCKDLDDALWKLAV